jgi:predicted neuraminidase
MKQFLLSIFLLVVHAGFSQVSWKKIKEELILDQPPFQQCHASTIVELSPGHLMTAFFGGDHEGDKKVSIWLTIQQHNHWSQPVSVAEGYDKEGNRVPCWNPVLFKSKEGKLFLFYKAGPNPREWWGMLRTSPDNGNTWTPAEPLPAGVLGPIKNKPVQLQDGTILSPSSVEVDEHTWKARIERSKDLGKTWEIIPVDTASTFKVIQPSILFHPGNQLQLLCRSDQNRVVEVWSADNGNTWATLSRTSLLNPNSGTDAVTLQNGLQLIVYNPTIRGKDWFNNRGQLSVAVSKDGKEWKDIIVLENAPDGNEYSYPAVIQTKDGNVHITYTYNRKNMKHVVLRQE